MARDIPEAVREVCLWFPEAEEYLSHGSPNFRVRGKTYATFVVNHHGDGRVALWLNAPDGARDHHVQAAPKHYFVPPYVGPRGWLGVHLDQGLGWKRIAQLVREAYEKVAPPALVAKLGKTIEITPPSAPMSAEQLDPMARPENQRVLKRLRAYCLSLPEVSEHLSFGSPTFRAGSKGFVTAYAYPPDHALKLAFWVGIERQSLYIADPRYSIPAYMGHNGWIALAPGKKPVWAEIEALALESYRHFALKRMLAKLPG